MQYNKCETYVTLQTARNYVQVKERTPMIERQLFAMDGPVMLDRELLTPEQVADYLQVHPETVRKWLREGQLAGINLGGRARWRIRRADVDRFIQTQQGPHDHLVIAEDFGLATYAGLVEGAQDAVTEEQKRGLWARLVGYFRKHPIRKDLTVRTPAQSALTFLQAAIEQLPEEDRTSWYRFLAATRFAEIMIKEDGMNRPS